MYLAEISAALGELLLGLISRTNAYMEDSLYEVQNRAVTGAEEKEIATAPHQSPISVSQPLSWEELSFSLNDTRFIEHA